MKKRIACVVLMALLCAVMVSGTAQAQVDWKQFQGTEVRFLMNKHPFTTFIEPKVAEFEKLTGIKVVMEVFPEDQYRNKRTIELNAGGKLDGYMIMPGQDDLYYWKAGWLQPMDDYIKDPKLTDAGLGPQGFLRELHQSLDGGRQADRRRHQCRNLALVLSQGPVRSVQGQGADDHEGAGGDRQVLPRQRG